MRTTVTLAVSDSVREKQFTAAGSCVVGRSLDCDLRIGDGDKRISRRHCLIEVDPPEARVRDLGSRNGTRVNGVAINGEQRLLHGDEIGIGDTVLRVSVGFTGYKIVRRLGQGSQGVVHLAKDLVSGSLVAVKTLWGEQSVDQQARTAFLREIENSRALRHPNVLEFHGAGAGGSAFLLASEYCAGGSLADLVTGQGGRLPVERAVPILSQVLDGLAYAHQAPVPWGNGLVHRDVKPHNIFLAGTTEEPVAKIGDFGLAKAFDRAGLSGHTRTGALGGSVAFMPRAQVVNYKYAKPEVDVWAAAATLYWTLTGETPRTFPRGEDPVTVVLTDPVVPIRERDPAIPARLAEVLDAALLDPPPIRTAAELAGALRAAQGQGDRA
ncbi:protein kinase [Crossiella sp. SN42]|uniref:protein kinase domain-containing protein n=1 Tax=Crossiella sp. SN42 TaxID=2944808 RepID=UPI00207D1370|nr:FHA domain-containing serine/threonine-protein kinase [Crossiella sp. SN42]MCO1574659.1 protein kinase [Crossiella sp. SN42]